MWRGAAGRIAPPRALYAMPREKAKVAGVIDPATGREQQEPGESRARAGRAKCPPAERDAPRRDAGGCWEEFHAPRHVCSTLGTDERNTQIPAHSGTA